MVGRWAVCGLIAVALLATACMDDGTDMPPAPAETPADAQTQAPADTEGGAMALSLTSDAFDEGRPIPVRFTCDGDDVSPPLAWSGAPDGTRAFALIMDDPDAPVGVFTHWVLFDLPETASSLPEGVDSAERPAVGGVHGRNDFGRTGYGGPCPPGGTHRYRFFLYALDQPLGLGPGASKQQVLDAVQGHVLAEAQLTGTYGR